MLVISESPDVLLLAEYYADNLVLPRSHLRLVHKGSGWRDVIQQIRTGGLIVAGYKILVVLIGRAEVLDRSCSVEMVLQQLHDVVSLQDPAIVLVLSTPLPWPTDGPQVARKLFRTTAVLKAFCHGKASVEFSRASEQLVTLEQVNTTLVDMKGLTEHGAGLIAMLIDAKINCSRLRLKYQELSSLGLACGGGSSELVWR